MTRFFTFLLYFKAISLCIGSFDYEGRSNDDDDKIYSIFDMIHDDKLMDITEQCLSSQMSYGFQINPLVGAISKLDDYCTDTDESKFESAFVDYEKCTGTDFSEFIETFWDALLGMSFTCAPYAFKVARLVGSYVDDTEILEVLKRPMPDECVDSLLGENAFGDFVREHTVNPGKQRKCLSTLGRQVPDCTLRRWPVPIPGYILKAYSCIENKIPALDMCKAEVEKLRCLPTVDEMKKSNSGVLCQEWTKACTLDLIEKYDSPALTLVLPPPLSAHPFPDICKVEDVSGEISARLKTYQETCLSEKDRSIWSSLHGFANVPMSPPMNKLKKFQNIAKPRTGNSKSQSSSWSVVFLLGLIIGIACTVLFTIFKTRRAFGSTIEHQRLEMGVQFT